MNKNITVTYPNGVTEKCNWNDKYIVFGEVVYSFSKHDYYQIAEISGDEKTIWLEKSNNHADIINLVCDSRVDINPTKDNEAYKKERDRKRAEQKAKYVGMKNGVF